jgi:hypothetical protein
MNGRRDIQGDSDLGRFADAFVTMQLGQTRSAPDEDAPIHLLHARIVADDDSERGRICLQHLLSDGSKV